MMTHPPSPPSFLKTLFERWQSADWCDRLAYVDATTQATYGQLYQAVMHEALVLPSNPRVWMDAPLCYKAWVLVWAVWYQGGIVCFAHQRNQTTQERLLRLVQPTHRASLNTEKNLVLEEVSPTPDDEPSPLPALLAQLYSHGQAGSVLCSSGTTGTPKLAVHQLEAWLTPMLASLRKPPKRSVAFLLFDHIGGQNTLLHSAVGGHTIIVPNSLNMGDVVQAIEAHEANLLITTPSFLRLLALEEDATLQRLHTLQTIRYGTEVMDAFTLQTLQARLPQATFVQSYGSTEAGILPTRSVGGEGSTWIQFSPSPYAQLRVVDGLLEVKTKASMLGYLEGESSFTPDGWIHTGDAVETSPCGQFLRIVGRANQFINVGGRKVNPLEVEQALMQHPAVADVVVFAKAVPLLGQAVACRVVVRDDSVAWTPAQALKELKAFLAPQLEAYKHPMTVELVGALPRTHTGKPIRACNEGC
ncbi:MAG: class I adenylate-forming enzyme family protein [Vampirovibrionales bacterium]